MIHKSLFLLLFILACCQCGKAQVAVFSFEEVDRLQELAARPVLVFIGTDWCRYCEKMEHTTFQAPAVLDLLEQYYYFVPLNAEEKRSIRFNGHDFHFKPTGTNTGIHELAEALATIDGQIAYPSLCILNTQYEILFQYHQYLSAEELVLVLKALLIEKGR